MTWKLFLDDIRPAQYIGPIAQRLGFDWTELEVARSSNEAKKLIEEKGCPEFIFFDHDLAEEHYTADWSNHAKFQSTRETGHDFAKWLIYKDIEARGSLIPANFGFYVHSMNPIGAENIRSIVSSYLEYKRGA